MTDHSTPPARRATEIHGFIRRQGKYLVDENGDEWFIRGGSFDGGVLGGGNGWNPSEPYRANPRDEGYRGFAEMGINTVRFLINENLFRPLQPGEPLRESALDWIQENVDWAKKYNIRLILNMHVVPGSSWAHGNGTHLFEEENARLWLDIWTFIARRFAEEPVIAGYSFWNEQFAPAMDSFSEALEVYGGLYQRCIDAVRQVDKKHLIVCEQMYGRLKDDRCYDLEVPAFPPLREENLMYEYHDYAPPDFCFQGDWKEPGTVYGSPFIADFGLRRGAKALAPERLEAAAMNSGFTALRTGAIGTAGAKALAASPVIALVGDVPAGAAAFVDDWQVRAFDAQGRDQGVVLSCGVDNPFPVRRLVYEEYRGKVSFDAAVGNTAPGSLRVTETEGRIELCSWSQDFFRVQPGWSYTVEAFFQGEALPDGVQAQLGLQFWESPVYGRLFGLDREMIAASTARFSDWRDAHGYPVYCGEWGAMYTALAPGMHGEQWVDDVLSVFLEQQMYFAVHSQYAMYGPESQPTFAELQGHGQYVTVVEEAYRRWMPRFY